MPIIEISIPDYIERNCKKCKCKGSCDLYTTLLYYGPFSDSTATGKSEICEFKNIRGVNQIGKEET